MKKTSKTTAAYMTPSDRRATAKPVAPGTIVFFRADELELPVPAMVVSVREGGPPPKGSKEPDPARFAELVVFSAAGARAHVSVREGERVGEWSTES